MNYPETRGESARVPSAPESAHTRPGQQTPGVLFAMRYPDDEGYVWNTITHGRDKAAIHLGDRARCFIAYPRLTGHPSCRLTHLAPVELDCYDTSDNGKAALAAFVRQHAIRVVVFMSALPSTLDMRFLRRLGVRTLNTENDSFDHRKHDPLPVNALKFTLRRMFRRQLHDLHLANARSQSDFLAHHAQIPASNLALLTDGVDCERFCPGDRQAVRRKLGLDPDRFWIVCVAQARTEKRLDMIIRAARHIAVARPEQTPGFFYIGDGDGPLPGELRRLAAELGLGDRFHFMGRQDDVVPYYQAADLMVHAAERESFGLAIVEAMASGLPVVASAAAGPSETVVHGETGTLVGLDDFDGFVRAILAYLDDGETRARHGANARRHAVRKYSIERYGRELADYIGRFL